MKIIPKIKPTNLEFKLPPDMLAFLQEHRRGVFYAEGLGMIEINITPQNDK